MVHAVQVRPISNEEGNRLLRMVRRGMGSVVTWRWAQMVLLSAQHMPVAKIAEVTFTSPDRLRENCTTSTPTDSTRCGLSSPAAGHRSSPCPAAADQEDRAQPLSRSAARPITTCPSPPGACRSWPTPWSPRGLSTTSPTRGLRALLRDEDVSFQAVKTFKASIDPDYETKTQPRAAALRDRRRHRPTPPGRSNGRVLRR